MSDQEATAETTNQAGSGHPTFVPPESQEALDKIVQERVARSAAKVEERVRKEFEGWVSPDDAKSLRADLEAKDEQLTAYAREEVAADAGLPKGFGSRLQGSTADEWKQDADSLAGVLLNSVTSTVEKAVEEAPAETPAPGYRPRERRGVGGGDPAWADQYANMSPKDLIKDIPRL